MSRRIPVTLLLGAAVALSGPSPLGAEQVHQACSLKHHECGQTIQAPPCCRSLADTSAPGNVAAATKQSIAGKIVAPHARVSAGTVASIGQETRLATFRISRDLTVMHLNLRI